MKRLTLAVTSMLVGVAAAGVAVGDKWSDQFPHIKNTGDIPGECSYESMSQKGKTNFKSTAGSGSLDMEDIPCMDMTGSTL